MNAGNAEAQSLRPLAGRTNGVVLRNVQAQRGLYCLGHFYPPSCAMFELFSGRAHRRLSLMYSIRRLSVGFPLGKIVLALGQKKSLRLARWRRPMQQKNRQEEGMFSWGRLDRGKLRGAIVKSVGLMLTKYWR